MSLGAISSCMRVIACKRKGFAKGMFATERGAMNEGFAPGLVLPDEGLKPAGMLSLYWVG